MNSPDQAAEAAAEKIRSLELRGAPPGQGEGWRNARGCALVYPEVVVLALDGDHKKMRPPCHPVPHGDKKTVSIEMRGLLRDISAKQLGDALKEKGLVLVRQKCTEKNANGNCGPMYLGLLSETAGTCMLGGKVDGHLHWPGLDCFRRGATTQGSREHQHGRFPPCLGSGLNQRDRAALEKARACQPAKPTKVFHWRRCSNKLGVEERHHFH